MVASGVKPKVICKDKQNMYIKVNNTVYQTNSKYKLLCELYNKHCAEQSNVRQDASKQDNKKYGYDKQAEDVISVDVKDYISVLDKMLQGGYFVGVSDEISKNNIKSVRKNEFTGYGEITIVLKNEVIDIISKAICDDFTLANIVVADNKEFDRTLSEVKRKSLRSRLLLFDGEKNYIKNRWY